MACTEPGPAQVPDADVVVTDGAVESCAPSWPAELTIVEGGRAVLPALEEGWAGMLEVEPSDALLARARPDQVTVYAEYGATARAQINLRSMDCASVVVDVRVTPLEWTPLAQWEPATMGPLGREYGAAWVGAYEDRDGLFLFGGFHYVPRQFTPANDFWFFDFETVGWTELPSADAPYSPGARVAEGRTAGSLLFHGGSEPTTDGSLSTPRSLWSLRFEGRAPVWTEAAHADSSPGSYTGAFLRDARRERWLSVCGADSIERGIHCQVLAYTEEGGWTDVTVEGEMPPGRFGFHYAMDETSDRVIVVAGMGAGGVLGDTWALELSSDPPRWERLFEDLPEVRRRNGAFVMDPIGQRLLLWGGTADGRTAVTGLSALRLERGEERWDHVPMPESVRPRASGFGVYDPARVRAIFGLGNADAIYTDLYALSL